MALLSSSLMAGLVVVTFFVTGADVVIATVFGIVMVDDDSMFSSGDGVSGISVVNICTTLALVIVSVLCQPEVVNSSSSLIWTLIPTFSGWALLLTWDSSNSGVVLVTKVKSTGTSSIPVMLLLSVSGLTVVFCITSSTMDKVTLAFEVWVVTASGIGVFESVKKLLDVFMGTFGVVASTLMPVVRIMLYSVYEILLVVVPVSVADGGLVVFTVKLKLLMLTLGVVSG